MVSEVENFYKKNKIYISDELQKEVSELEDRYFITSDFETFQHHVNFSKNTDIPIHNWFKYREGYSYKLIDILLEDSGITQDEFVIDPFCGSGTTQLQANIHNISSLGIDINPMSAFISDAKSSALMIQNTDKLLISLEYILTTAQETKVDFSSWQDITRYFDEDKLEALIKIFEVISSLTDKILEDFFKLCALSIVETVSNRKRDGNGLATRQTKVSCVYTEFKLKAQRMISELKSLKENNKINDFTFESVAGNSEMFSEHVYRFSKESKKKPGAIIFSPPYANSFDYFESYKLELRLGGYSKSISDLKKYRDGAVRSFISDSSNRDVKYNRLASLIAEDIEKSIPDKETLTGKRDNRTRKVPRMIMTYFNDMANVIEQCSKALPSGKKCYIVVDQSSYLGKIVPSDLLLANIAEEYEFNVEKLVVCRRAKTSPQQAKRFQYLKEALRESIVVLIKK